MNALLLSVVWLGLACSSAFAQRSFARPRPSLPSSAELRLGTYNIYVGAAQPSQTAAVIRRMKADVVALQEVTPASATALDQELARAFPYRYFSSGLGLVSRFPLRRPRFQRSTHGINGFLFAEIDHPRGRLQIVNLHLDPLRLWRVRDALLLPYQLWRGQRTIHRAELVQVFANLESGMPTILLGDLNRVSDGAIKRVRELGYIDSFASVTSRPDRTATLHFSILHFHAGRRIDFIFHDPTFRTTKSQVLPGQPSDHDAVRSLLRWNPATARKR